MIHVTQCINYIIHESTQIKYVYRQSKAFSRNMLTNIYIEHIKIVVCGGKRGVGMEYREKETSFKDRTDTFQGGI